MPEKLPSNDEMIACLRRSGYCMEGRITKLLMAQSYFVETSQPLFDEQTKKTREIDLVADYFDWGEEGFSNISVSTTLVIEAINTTLPTVLLTPKPWSPFDSEDSLVPYSCTPPESCEGVHSFFDEASHAELFTFPDSNLYCQYCGFTRKKSGDQLMASHPDDMHTSLQKAVEYSLIRRNQAHKWMSQKPSDEKYWRIFNWQPVIVVNAPLFALREPDSNNLISLEQAYFSYNFFFENAPRSVAVSFVTESGLTTWTREILERDKKVEERLAKLRYGSQSEN